MRRARAGASRRLAAVSDKPLVLLAEQGGQRAFVHRDFVPPVECRAIRFREVAAPRTRELVAQPVALLARGTPAGVVDPRSAPQHPIRRRSPQRWARARLRPPRTAPVSARRMRPPRRPARRAARSQSVVTGKPASRAARARSSPSLTRSASAFAHALGRFPLRLAHERGPHLAPHLLQGPRRGLRHVVHPQDDEAPVVKLGEVRFPAFRRLEQERDDVVPARSGRRGPGPRSGRARSG